MNGASMKLVAVTSTLATACLLIGGLVAGRAWADHPVNVDLGSTAAVVAAVVAGLVILIVVRAKRPDAFDELVTVLLAIWALCILAGLAWSLFCIWSALPGVAGQAKVDIHWIGSSHTWSATKSEAAAALVLAAGGLGGAVHIARSFARLRSGPGGPGGTSSLLSSVPSLGSSSPSASKPASSTAAAPATNPGTAKPPSPYSSPSCPASSPDPRSRSSNGSSLVPTSAPVSSR